MILISLIQMQNFVRQQSTTTCMYFLNRQLIGADLFTCRYEKVIKHSIHNFKAFNLDLLIVATNAPGRSAYNRVERRMAPLSRELSGVILEHDHYGTHLDNNGRTVDTEKEGQNFEFAGKTLADIWSELSFDKHPVVAEYVGPNESELQKIITVSAEWKLRHIRESHYCLQVT